VYPSCPLKNGIIIPCIRRRLYILCWGYRDNAGKCTTFVHCYVYPGRADNIKVTRPEDLALAEFYLTRTIHQENT
ncbi:2-C-methyl-D-erythritol 4-phosphate cytidylyltransferase, partial [Escherichia sp. R-CC3]